MEEPRAAAVGVITLWIVGYFVWSLPWVRLLRQHRLPTRWAFVPFGHSFALGELSGHMTVDIMWRFGRIPAFYELGRRYGKSPAFGTGLWLCTPLFVFLLARDVEPLPVS